MSDPKPCPFCGGEVKVLPWADRHTWVNECTFFCGCSKCRTVGDCYGTEAEAVAAWNTRVNDMTDEQRSHLTRLAEEMVDVLALSGGGVSE